MFGRRTQGTSSTGLSVVDAQLVMRGDLDTNGIVRVDGQVLGVSHRAGTLIIGVGGLVVGNVEAREVIVAGAVQGNVHARGRVEIEKNATVHGQVQAASMTMREGGSVNGQLSIGAKPQASQSEGDRVEHTLPTRKTARSRA